MYSLVLILHRLGWVLLALIAVVAVVAPQPSRQLTIETGPAGGSYHAAAVRYAASLQQQGLDVVIRPNDDSLTIIDHVNAPDSAIDLGFVVQNVDPAKYPGVVSLGSTEYQPLFVFYRAELGDIDSLAQLKGRRLAFPARASATSETALTLLGQFGITETDTPMSFRTLTKAHNAVLDGEADAAFLMLAASNPLIEELGLSPGLRLMRVSQAAAIGHLMPNLHIVPLAAGSFSLKDSRPAEEVPLVAATTEVIAKNNLDASIVYLVMQAMASVHANGDRLAKHGEFPSEVHGALPLSTFAQQYYRTGVPWDYRTLPLPLAVLFRYYIAIILPLAVIGPLWDVIGLPKPIAISPVVLLQKGRRRLHAYLLRRAEGQLERGKLAGGARRRTLDQVLAMIERTYARRNAPDELVHSARRLREKLAEIRAEPAIVKAPDAEPSLGPLGGGAGGVQRG